MAMKRQKKYIRHYDDNSDFTQMQTISQPKFEKTLEAQVQDGETLQSLALRFHCTVADIKRLNKIDKDNEIYARKVVKIPVTVQSVLVETLPIVHKSGNNSPKHLQENESNVTRNPFEDKILSEKLLLASVNAAGDSINDIILQSTIKKNHHTESLSEGSSLQSDNYLDTCEPLLSGIHDETIPQPMTIPAPSVRLWDWSGSDGDMSWVCLFIAILGMCFAIPLIYVWYIADPKRLHHSSL